MKAPENEAMDNPVEERGESPTDQQREGTYTPPPTARDASMSAAHHVDSLKYNLRHADAHLKEAKLHAGRLAKRLPAASRAHLRKVSR
jgi:hypothetical protein